MATDLLNYTNLEDYFTIPDNINLARKTRAKIFIQRCPNTNFFCSGFTLPDMTIQPVDIPTFSFKSANEVGDHFSISPLSFDLLIDEDYESYLELVRWFQYAVRNGSVQESYSNAIAMIYDSELKPLISIQFFYLFPISIGAIQYDTAEDEVISVPISMQFLDLEIEKTSTGERLFRDFAENQFIQPGKAFNGP